MGAENKLAELGLELPEAPLPIAAYVPVVRVGDLLHISGQLPFRDGKLMAGRVGDDRDEDYGAMAAEASALSFLAQVRKEAGSLDQVARIVKLGVFVASTPEFTGQPKVANGASELMVTLFGEDGRHARSAVGVPSLPLGAVVEIDGIVQLRGG
jgi:enamine deaminase RidA (YjgF/YER057c/UK114 family)